jgi:hypothetical protein
MYFTGAPYAGPLVDLVAADTEGAPGQARFHMYGHMSKCTLSMHSICEELAPLTDMDKEDRIGLLRSTLVSPEGSLASKTHIKEHHVVLIGSFNVSDTTTIPCGISKKALLSMHVDRQMNSEVIDAFMAHVTATRNVESELALPTYVPAKLMPSKPTDVVRHLGWKWIKPYLKGGVTFLFLLHEEHIEGEAGHFVLLYVDTTKDVIHVLDPLFTDVASTNARLGSLSHLKKWVPAFFNLYRVATTFAEYRLKMAYPMACRPNTAARRKVSKLSTQNASHFSMHTQTDSVNCGVVCAQVAEEWVAKGSPPSHTSPLRDCGLFREVMLCALYHALRLPVE